MKKLFILTAVALFGAMGFVSCDLLEDESGLTVNKTSVELYALDEYTITTNSDNATFTSENPYVAVVDKRTGEVTAMTIGKTVIKITSDKGDAKVKVTVKQKYSTYEEPCTEFGKTMSQITAKYGTPDVSEDNVIMYVHNKPKHTADVYLFENNKLYASGAIIPAAYAEEAAYFLLERYWAAGVEDDILIFMNSSSPETATMAVAISPMDEDYFEILYIPASVLTSVDSESIVNMAKTCKPQLAKRLK